MFRLRITAQFSQYKYDDIVLESSEFHIEGKPAISIALYAAIAVLMANFLLTCLAARILWIRRVLLHPVGSVAVGLVVGKFLFTDLLIRFVYPLKLALFEDYRRSLSQSAMLDVWKNKRYVQPQIEVIGLATGLVGDFPVWQKALTALIDQPRDCLWLIQGPSGLGKTALLQQWTKYSLELGKTPILIHLGSNLTPQEEAAALMAQYGEINVKPDLAHDLLTGGGFIIFLDGLNEDKAPDVTREFVRQIVKRNLVVITSQFDPLWDKVLSVRRIKLDPFGYAELRQLISKEWARAIIEAPHLGDAVQLPVTAQLLVRYIDNNQSLPGHKLRIYEDLYRSVRRKKQSLNLEEQAWTLFRHNNINFKPDPGLTIEFLDSAVEVGILTRYAVDDQSNYRFAHELIHRYLCACYLIRQDRRDLVDLHSQVKPGIDRNYWVDTLDFWGEMLGRRALEDEESLNEYYEFLRQAAVFSSWIFAKRLYPQYDLLVTNGLIAFDRDFVALAARLLARFRER